MAHIANLDVVKSYQNAHKNDKSDKVYPNLMLVRSMSFLAQSRPIKILDHGCGYGSNTRFLSNYGEEIYYSDTCAIAIEKTATKLIDCAASMRSHGVLLDPNNKNLPFNSDYFDLIVCSSVLSLLSSRDNVLCLLQEFNRVIRPGGMLFLDINGTSSEFCVYSEKLSSREYLYRGRNRRGTPIQVYCPDNVEEFSELIGEVFQVEECGHTSHDLFGFKEQEFIVIASKKVT